MVNFTDNVSAINFKSTCLKGSWLQNHISGLYHMLQIKIKISAKYCLEVILNFYITES